MVTKIYQQVTYYDIPLRDDSRKTFVYNDFSQNDVPSSKSSNKIAVVLVSNSIAQT